MDFNEDRYWENRREEYEGSNRKPVAKCESCGCDMYSGQECYRICNDYYCKDCVCYDTLEDFE